MHKGQVRERNVKPLATGPKDTSKSTLVRQQQISTTHQRSAAVALFFVWASIVTYIFGGCCSNVYALEKIVKYEPQSGYLITFVQFALTAAVASWPHLDLSKFPWALKRPKVPVKKWIPSVLMFFAVNVLNNLAFGYRISVPVHIILRSGGSVSTMLVGFIMGRKYSTGKTVGVLILTAGVVLAAMADAKSQGRTSASPATSAKSFIQGLTILFVAQLISAFMGLHTQKIYEEYGPQWQENLFYTHLLSLPGFFLFYPEIVRSFLNLSTSRPTMIPLTGTIVTAIPEQISLLLLNACTQLFCILGVNRLAAETTALGVTIVLNIRKLVSLLLSTLIFGNRLPALVWVGAALVFSGGAVYAAGDLWMAWLSGTPNRAGGPKKLR